MPLNARFTADFTDYVRGTQQADAAMVKLQAGTAHTQNTFRNFHAGLSQVDRIMGSMGVHIGPQVAALGELAAVAGKTAAQLGLLATGSAVLATLVGAFTLTRAAINKFFPELDEVVAKTASSLLGFGDVAEEVAGHKLDILARATKLAGTEIKDYDQALKIITDSNDRFAESVGSSAHRISLWQGEIRKVRAAGDMEALKRDLDGQHFSLKELSAMYHISADALQFFVKYTKDADEATKAFAKAQEEAARSLRAFKNFIGEREIEDHQKALDAQEKAEREYRQFLNWVGERQMEEESARLQQREAEHAATLARMAQAEAMLAGLTITGGASGLGSRGTVTFDESGNMVTGGGSQFTPGSNISVFSGAPGPMRSGSGFLPQSTFTTNVNVSGVMDPRTISEIGRAASMSISQAVARGTKFS